MLRRLPVRALRTNAIKRRSFVTPAYELAKKVMPKISATEKAALNAGSVGFDGDIFNGSPSLSSLLDAYDNELTEEEQSFMDNEVEELCHMLDDYQVSCTLFYAISQPFCCMSRSLVVHTNASCREIAHSFTHHGIKHRSLVIATCRLKFGTS